MTRALIIGGGIAGPATAMALRKAGLEPVVYEAYDRTAEGIGAFLTVAVNGLDALDTLGLRHIALKYGFDAPSMSMNLGSGRKLAEFPNGGPLPDGTVAQVIKRGDLYRGLRDEVAARGVRIEYDKRLVGVDETGDGIAARFADGTTATGDILIGADGLRSTVRTIIDPQAPPVRSHPLLNTGGYAEGVRPDTEPGVLNMVFGKRCFYCYILAPDGTVWWFANPLAKGSSDLVGLPMDQVRTRLVEMLDVDSTPGAEIVRATPELARPYGTYDLPTVPHWNTGRMLLVGDASHAASPASGQGASMAFEDAVTIGRCLRDHGDSAGAFAAFAAQRRDRVEAIVAAGLKNGIPKERGFGRRVLEHLVMRMVVARAGRTAMKAARTAAEAGESYTFEDANGWMTNHHIDWDVPVDG